MHDVPRPASKPRLLEQVRGEPAVALHCRVEERAGVAFVLSGLAAGLAGSRNVSGLEEFFQRFSAEAGDHLRIGYAFDAREFLEAEEARAVAHERGPVELAHHSALLGTQPGPVKGRNGIFLEERAVAGEGETVEETVEAERLGAGGEVEEIGAVEFFGALELGVHLVGGPSLRSG